ncbi:MAG: glycosyltransferase family 4 protein [Planctomycetaceae bacterium]|jgi:glycosyltransferase involved in cell wall biosynthesis|nr:glycosyltransferase family 4 protein [Planctomycetaceae bacterium]
MQILVLDEWLPSMLNSGKSIRSFRLLAPLAKKHRITYLAHLDSAGQAENIRRMEDAGFEVICVPRPKIYASVPSILLGAIPSLLNPLPISVRRHFSANYVHALQNVVREKTFDLVHIEWTHYAIYGQFLSQLPQFIGTHNVEYLSWSRFAKTTKNPAKFLLGLHESRKMYRFEKEIYRNTNYLSTVSEEDAQLIRQEFGVDNLCIIPNGVDISYYDAVPNNPQPDRIVYCGSMDAAINQDAVLWFIKEIFPRILRKKPKTMFTVIGRYPPKWLLKFQSDRITFTGSVADVREPLKKAMLEVVPLRIGGGSRLKILEAFAAGIPVVSTTLGAEGLKVTANQNLVLADTPTTFAEHCIELLNDTEQRSQLIKAGRQLVDEKYDLSQISPLVETAWNRTLELTN